MKKFFNAFVIFCLSFLILSCSGNFGSMQKGSVSIDSEELMGAVARASARELSGGLSKNDKTESGGWIYSIDTGVSGGYSELSDAYINFYSSYMKRYSDFISERLKSNVDIEFSAEGDYSVYRKETVSMDFSKLFEEDLFSGSGTTEIDYNGNYGWETTKYEKGKTPYEGTELLVPVTGNYPESGVGSAAGEEELILSEFENLDSKRIQEILSIKDLPVGTKLKLKVSVRFYIDFDATKEEFLNALGLSQSSESGTSITNLFSGFDKEPAAGNESVLIDALYSSVYVQVFSSAYDVLSDLNDFSVTFECESDTITIAPGNNEITLNAKLIGNFGDETIEIPLDELDDEQSEVNVEPMIPVFEPKIPVNPDSTR